jgi:hypothetical protein
MIDGMVEIDTAMPTNKIPRHPTITQVWNLFQIREGR